MHVAGHSPAAPIAEHTMCSELVHARAARGRGVVRTRAPLHLVLRASVAVGPCLVPGTAVASVVKRGGGDDGTP